MPPQKKVDERLSSKECFLIRGTKIVWILRNILSRTIRSHRWVSGSELSPVLKETVRVLLIKIRNRFSFSFLSPLTFTVLLSSTSPSNLYLSYLRPPHFLIKSRRSHQSRFSVNSLELVNVMPSLLPGQSLFCSTLRPFSSVSLSSLLNFSASP